MKLTLYTAAAILAFSLTQAGALPSPQAHDAGVTIAEAPPAEEPMYYPEEDADVEKRDDKKHESFGKTHPGPHGEWPPMQRISHNHKRGPMPDEDSINLTPYFSHPDPVVAALASVVKRAPNPGMTKINGLETVQVPGFHWWQNQGDGTAFMPQVGGNPNVGSWSNAKEMLNRGKAISKRDADSGEHHGPGGAGGQHEGGHGGQTGDQQGGQQGGHGMGGQGHGGGQGQHASGPPAGMGGGKGGGQGGQGGQPWANKGQGGQGH